MRPSNLVFLFSTVAALVPASSYVRADVTLSRPEQVVSREEWGSKPDPIPESRRHVPRMITLQHAGVLWTNSVKPEEFVRNMQAWGKKRPEIEQPPRNTFWPDVPYHFLIAPDGRIFEGRPLEYEPDTNTKYDVTGHLGVEMVGDFDRQRPSVEQLTSAVQITAWLMQEFEIPIDQVRTHRDVAPGQTGCPGRDFYRYMLDGQFRKWIRTVQAGEELRIDPGPPLPAERAGPTELVTETRKREEKPAGE